MGNVSITSLTDIEAALTGTGIHVRGAFAAQAGDDLPALADGRAGRVLVLLGNIGGSIWPAFADDVELAERDRAKDPLDDWVRSVVDPLAQRFHARPVHPSDRPYAPFQRWAMRAEAVHPSPLGLLIHPVYGLWHAYRAALVFGELLDGLPEVPLAASPSPCQSCQDRPCLSACPVAAFDGNRYDVAACTCHLRSANAPDCREIGCRARDACPLGQGYRYPDAQIRFHMAAFLAARI